MTDAEIRSKLKSCGQSFYVEFFQRFCETDWHDDDAVKTLKHNIASQLQSEGVSFEQSSLDTRISCVRAIFKQNAQWKALLLVAEAKGIL